MSLSLVIRNGLVVDPANGTEKIASVLIDGRRFAGICECGAEPEATQVIDAEGCIVTPGLIDSHCHFFYAGTENGVHPDATLLPMGVTGAIDQGSAGSGNFQAFYDTSIAHSRMRLYAAMNISTQGLVTSRYPENLDPRFVKLDDMERLFERYPHTLVGIKTRISKELVGDMGIGVLESALNAAKAVGTRIAVHTTNPPIPVPEFIGMFRAGDIYAHTYQGRGFSILNEETGKLFSEVHEARKRGVVFDSSDARVHYLYAVQRQALAEGFLPDTISTDLVQGSLFQPGVFGLPRVMSKYLTLGMKLSDVVNAVTYRAAQVIGKENRIGSMTPGCFADCAIFKYKETKEGVTDRLGNTLALGKMLIPQCTILDGKVVFRQFDF